jgi:hypothetical protein
MRREASTFTGRQPRYCEPATIFVLVSGSLAKACKAFASCWGSWHGAANRRFLVWPLAAYEGFSISPE